MNNLVIIVEDNGPGISKSEYENVFSDHFIELIKAED